MPPPPCPHLESLQLRQPGHHITRPTECTQCFDDQDMQDGIDVCLTCFNGGCPRLHAQAHSAKFGNDHACVVNIRRVRKVEQDRTSSSSRRQSGEEPPQKKLAIREEPPEHEKYDIITRLKCYACGSIEVAGNDKTDAVVSAILSTMSTTRQSEVKAWEQELETCKHTRDLVQLNSKQLQQSGLAHCSSCELNQNLWLCLTCGDLNCGRQQFGGIGGNGHAVAHYTGSGHPVSVKLGTIQPNGTADIYCYACDDEKLDPSLSQHLAHWGIQVESQVKTEKSLSELQVEQNLKFDFAMSGEDGKQLEPVFGPGLTGLRNLGNSCYMASVLQTLFALPAFSDRYLTKGAAHPLLCQNVNPANCFECQMTKMADGLLSGRYSHPRSTQSEANDDETAKTFAPSGSGQGASLDGSAVHGTPSIPFQEGIQPSMFKSLVGKDHPEFSTMRQQDSEEFFKHLVNMIQKAEQSTAGLSGSSLDDDDGPHDPTDIFKFQLQERLQCTTCKGVRYSTVSEESFSLPVPFIATSTTDESSMDIDPKGKSSAEHPISKEANTAASIKQEPAHTTYQPVTLEECLRLMCASSTTDYKCPACDKTVTAEKSTSFATFPDTLVIQAKKFTLVNWVPQKIDVPLVLPTDLLKLDEYKGTGKVDNEIDLPGDEISGSSVEFNEDALQQLEAMGFPLVRCQKALLATGNADAEAAMNWLFAHMEDPDIDDPIPAASLQSSSPSQQGGSSISTDSVSMVQDMGFTADQARKALLESGGSVEAAVEWLFSNPGDPGLPEMAIGGETSSNQKANKARGRPDLPANYRLKAFISHKGNSIHVGHYVAHVHKEGVGWVLFNDEKVVKADGGAQSAIDLMPFAYLYVFQRVDENV